MQTFAHKKIVLAVGSALMIAAGTAQAATPPVLRAANPAVVAATAVVSDANTRALLSAAGLSGQAVTVSVNLTSTVTTAGIDGDIQAVLPGAPTVLVTTLNVADATLANRNVLAYTGTLSATTALPVTSATFVPGTATSGTASITVVLPAATAPAAYRVNAGNLEYTADGVTFAAVKIDVQSATAVGAIIYTENTGATPAAPAVAGYLAAADQVMSPVTVAGTVKNSLAPTPTMATTGSAAGLVNGLTINTGTPITLAAANLAIKTVANGAQTFPAAAVAAPVCATSICTVTFTNLGATATAADFVAPVGTPDAADAAYYNSTNFNTGVAGGTVPFTVDGTATEASYTEVFNVADGLASKLAISTGAVDATHAAKFSGVQDLTDGATPVIVTTAGGNPDETNPSGTNLQITFSEPMGFIYGGAIDSISDLREIMENVFLSGNFTSNSSPATSASLAAIALNDGLNLNASMGTTDGQSTLTISGLTGGELTPTSTVSVTTGITFKEANDSGYSATVPAIDDAWGYEYTDTSSVALYGGVMSLSGAVEAASVTAKAVTPAVVSVDFDEATAYAQTTAADPSKVGQIIVTFPAGKEISLASGLTSADLVKQIRVTVFNGNNWTKSYQFFPTAAQMAVNTAGTQLTITLPTDQIYANIDSWDTMSVDYLGLVAGNGALVKKASAAIAVASLTAADRVAEGDVNVKLPLSAINGANAGLITQSIIGDFAQVTNGDRVTAFLAHWESAPKANAINLDDLTGTVTAPAGNKLAFGGGEEGSLRTEIQTQLNDVAAAKAAVPGVSEAVAAVTTKAIPVYFVVRDGVATLYDDATSAGNASKAIIDDINSAAAEAGWDGSDATGADGSVANTTLSTNTTAVAALAAGNATAAANVVASWVDVPQATKMAAVNAAAAPGATPASVMKAVMATIADYKVKTASLNPVNGNITGAVTGKLVIKNTTTSTADRGLIIDSAFNADAIVGTVNGKPNSFNLLVGVDPDDANLKAAVKRDEFVILVHESANTGEYTMLTSADPTAANYLPFSANLLTGSGARTTLPQIDMTKIAIGDTAAPGWTLMPLGNPAKKAAPAGHAVSFDRAFVGLNGIWPTSVWTNDEDSKDMALAMVGSKATAATELGDNKATLSTITPASFIPGAAAMAWKNDQWDGVKMYVMQATPIAAKVPAGWSLVTVPASGTFGAAVKAVIKVGAQTNAPYTWVFGDADAPALTAGEAVFVYSPAGGAL